MNNAGETVRAEDIGLPLNAIAGQDGSRVLTELRPAPATSCVELVANLWRALDALRHVTRKYEPLGWVVAPVFNTLPIGGHIHFARKRGEKLAKGLLRDYTVGPLRGAEAAALDMLVQTAFDSGLLSHKLQLERCALGYGKFGDVRSQNHGYEYRVWPTWLHTPRFAHTILTLSKLAVLDPSLGKFLGKTPDLRQVLSFFARHDSDAALCAERELEKHPLPKSIRAAWGLSEPASASLEPWTLPEGQPMPAPASWVRAMQEHLASNRELRVPVPPLSDAFQPASDLYGFWEHKQWPVRLVRGRKTTLTVSDKLPLAILFPASKVHLRGDAQGITLETPGLKGALLEQLPLWSDLQVFHPRQQLLQAWLKRWGADFENCRVLAA